MKDCQNYLPVNIKYAYYLVKSIVLLIHLDIDTPVSLKKEEENVKKNNQQHKTTAATFITKLGRTQKMTKTLLLIV